MLQLSPHNHVILLRNGTEYFPALLESIANARTEIFFESYIFSEDCIGQEVMLALCKAARRGVRVHLLVDGFGSVDLSRDFLSKCKEAGVRVLFFRPDLAKFSLQKQRLRRMHRKMAVFDGKVAYVGGINIIEDAAATLLPPCYDYAVRIEGKLVASIHAAMDRLWRYTSWIQLKFEWAKRSRIKSSVSLAHESNVLAGLVIRDNLRHRHAIEEMYLMMIERAKEEIVIANAYFLPAKRICDALIAAAHRGAKVHIIVQGNIDHFIQYFATRALYERFFHSGIAIYEYTAGFMHAKVAVVDSKWATVGSSNIDPFSLLLAREANVLIQDHQFAKALREDMMKCLQENTVKVELRDLKAQPWLLRVLPHICYQLMRIVMGLLGYGKKEYQ